MLAKRPDSNVLSVADDPEAVLLFGLVAAALGGGIWFGFVVTTMTVNYAYHGARPKLTLIDGAHWLGVLLIQGMILGLLA